MPKKKNTQAELLKEGLQDAIDFQRGKKMLRVKKIKIKAGSNFYEFFSKEGTDIEDEGIPMSYEEAMEILSKAIGLTITEIEKGGENAIRTNNK